MLGWEGLGMRLMSCTVVLLVPTTCLHLQVKKAYGDDMQGIEAHEEMARMREHVLSEVCVCVGGWVCVMSMCG